MYLQRSSSYSERNLVGQSADGKLLKGGGGVKCTDSVVGKPRSGRLAPRKREMVLSYLELVGAERNNSAPKWTPNHPS
jgi:hypothetical protein